MHTKAQVGSASTTGPRMQSGASDSPAIRQRCSGNRSSFLSGSRYLFSRSDTASGQPSRQGMRAFAHHRPRFRNALRPPLRHRLSRRNALRFQPIIDALSVTHCVPRFEIESPAPTHYVRSFETERCYAMQSASGLEIGAERAMHFVSPLTTEPRAPLPLVFTTGIGHRFGNTSSHGVGLGERGGKETIS